MAEVKMERETHPITFHHSMDDPSASMTAVYGGGRGSCSKWIHSELS